jgi:hypothetical protein
MAYKDLILKIEKRFGFRELPETAQVQFNNAHQTPIGGTPGGLGGSGLVLSY